MSMPRNTWRESAEITSAGTPSSRNRRATAIDRPVLPVAVAPAITSRGGRLAGKGVAEPSVARDDAPLAIGPGGPPQRIRPGVLHPDAHERPEQRWRAREVHGLVL